MKPSNLAKIIGAITIAPFTAKPAVVITNTATEESPQVGVAASDSGNVYSSSTSTHNPYNSDLSTSFNSLGSISSIIDTGFFTNGTTNFLTELNGSQIRLINADNGNTGAGYGLGQSNFVGVGNAFLNGSNQYLLPLMLNDGSLYTLNLDTNAVIDSGQDFNVSNITGMGSYSKGTGTSLEDQVFLFSNGSNTVFEYDGFNLNDSISISGLTGTAQDVAANQNGLYISTGVDGIDGTINLSSDYSQIPEPKATATILGLGALGATAYLRRRKVKDAKTGKPSTLSQDNNYIDV